MKNRRIKVLTAFAIMLLAGCDDDSSTVSALEWPEKPESSVSTSSSSQEKSCFCSAQQSSSSDERVPSSSTNFSSSQEGTSSSSTPLSSSREENSSSPSLSSSGLGESSSSFVASSSSQGDFPSSSALSSSSAGPIDAPKPMIAYSQMGAQVENDNGCVEVSGGVVTISCGGTYEFSGSNSDGQIVINTLAEDSVVHIRLNNLTLKNASDAPFFVISSSRTIVKALEGSVNTFEDASTRSAVTYQKKGKDKQKTDTTGACIYAKDDLTINGKGILKVVANYKNGIQTSNDLRIRDNPTIDIRAPKNALKGKGSVDIEGGTIVLKAIDGAGIKSDEGEDENTIVADKGSIRIKGGKIRIRSGDNGIEAYNEIIVSDEVSVPEITINTLEKGLKSSVVKMGNAVTTITSDGDGWKVNDHLEVSAGFHYMNAGADGIDVKNTFSLTGGVVVVENVSDKESSSIVAFDSEINANGGALLGFGKNSKSGVAHNTVFTSGKFYGTATGAFSPSFDGTTIVVEQDGLDIRERYVSGWQSVCFPSGSTNCYYYK